MKPDVTWSGRGALLAAWGISCSLGAATEAVKGSSPASKAGGEKKTSLYRTLLKPIDVFTAGEKSKKVLPLSALYQQLMDHNLDIRQAGFDLNAAKDSYRIVYKNLRPKFGLSADSGLQYNYNQSIVTRGTTRDGSLGMSGDTDWGISYGANFPKITWSKSNTDGIDEPTVSARLSADAQVSLNLLRSSAYFVGGYKNKRARYAYDSAKQGYKTQVSSVLFSSESLYYQVYTAQAQVLIDEYTLKTMEALLDESKELYRLGEVAKFEVVQAELQLENGRAQLVSSQDAYQLALQQLREVVNADEIIYPDPQEVVAIPKQPSLASDKIYEAAMANRSEFLKAKWDLEQGHLSVSESYSGSWPSLALSASHSRSRVDQDIATSLGKITALGNPQSTITLTYSQDLSNYDANTAYKNSLTARLKLQIAFDNTKNQLRKEVESSISSVANAYKRYDSVIKAKKLSIEKLQAEFDRYRLGESSIKNVIDFQKEVNSQEKTDLDGRIAIFQALANLRKIQGLLPEKSTITLPE